MNFKTFIQEQVGPDQDDPFVNQVILLIQKDVNFPATADIKLLAQYLYKTLDHKQTTAFQKLIMFWKFSENNYRQPTEPNLLNEINYIIDLQDNNK